MNYTIDLGSLILHSFAAFAIAGYISAGYSRLGVGDLIATVGAAGLLALYATVKSLRS